ncbi:MAG: bifunctional UDP-N-acetylmuramoyl-tripeptide:D-alanyl-D-alanine ligase/alanine racemase [Chitinophagaceae bacterium]|nr:MAG: bifunctional UDP-N-acetylmuramoyl-tripeptide:D-alanyl-D-alanine ligase/alanine racemase [Chitinophagaceae bacterium]
MAYRIQDIVQILRADANIQADAPMEHLLIDSRKIVFPATSLFFAISGPRRDGHQFIKEVYERGVRNFVVRKGFDHSPYSDACFLQVENVLQALQQLAAYHRSRFSIPVIGITGSNGKTIVKEWLYQLLQHDHVIVRSPRSYNSQVGVPLSVWQLHERHTLGIFEAGISTTGEMEHLAAIIQPTTGVFTNLADPHSEGFENLRQKAMEKAMLFRNSHSLVFGRDGLQSQLDPDGADKNFFAATQDFFSWSRDSAATLSVTAEQRTENGTLISALYRGETVTITIPFTDRISMDNAITCWSVMLQMNYPASVISERMRLLEPVDMRMQLKKASNNCYLLNDSYSNDLSSLDLAIEHLQQQAGTHRTTLILSDILQSGQYEEALYRDIAAQLTVRGIHRFIGIGPAISRCKELFHTSAVLDKIEIYPSTESFLQQVSTHDFSNEYILLKGARVFAFERISAMLEQKVHQTVMEINLTAMVHNLKQYQQQLKPATKLMAMVKAFSYGSGSAEVARILQFHKVDYLAVAYADEGVELRKAGISLPIMVMNVDAAGFDSLVSYDLEPEIYSFPIYQAFHHYLDQQGIQQFPVHIKFNTGMNRLGFEVAEAAALAQRLHTQQTMAVKTVFSHLVASEAADHDRFTETQVIRFNEACKSLQEILGYHFVRHIANTAAIFRYPQYQFDMVRLGIGLYGVDSADGDTLSLQTVATLRSTIAQLRPVKAGESVGYNRKGVLQRDSLIATIRIGYADGFGRELGNGRASVYVNGELAPVVGNVCMDMTMIDVTGIAGVKEGMEVEIFGKHLPVQQMARWAGTIAYEIMTGISQRVKRVYLEE